MSVPLRGLCRKGLFFKARICGGTGFGGSGCMLTGRTDARVKYSLSRTEEWPSWEKQSQSDS